MGIYIKGLDMPNSGQVELVIRPHGKVFSKTLGIGKLEAIEIPTPHGRLIDGDELGQYIEGKGFVIGYKAIDEQKVILDEEE